MATVPEPAAPGAARAGAWATDPGERGRLRSPPAPAHAPLLLGIDTTGREHPQGPADPDDESLVGRCWGCVCGWRGTVRDIATRHFHPRVGDGGGLRRKRLARADRDARAELEHHLAAVTAASTPPAPAAATVPAPPTPPRALGDRPGAPAGGGAAASRAPRRRRLTLPRPSPDDHRATPPSPPAAAAPVGVHPTPPPPPAEQHVDIEEAPGSREPVAAPPRGEGPLPPDHAPQRGGDPDVRRNLPPALRASAPAPDDSTGKAIAAAADRARRARTELNTAEAALDAAVTAARAHGASWRTVARLSGIPYRDAAARWGDPSAGPTL